MEKEIIKKYPLLCIGLLSVPTLGQETNNYYPLQIGNLWEYRVQRILDSGFIGYDTLQVTLSFDSTDSAGNYYFILSAWLINPIEPPHFFYDEENRYAIYESDHIYYRRYSGFPTQDDRLEYKLDATEGETWIVKNADDWDYEVAVVREVHEEILFGQSRTTMAIDYYFTSDTSDTNIWLWLYSNVLAYGLGPTFMNGEMGPEAYLIGAVIEGQLYGDTTTVGISVDVPDSYPLALHHNYPNPFNSKTTILFELNKISAVSLTIFNLLGQEMVKLIESKTYNPGSYRIIWNGINQKGNKVSSGIYYYQLRTDDQILTKSMDIIY